VEALAPVENYDLWRPPPASFEGIADPFDKSYPMGVLRHQRSALVLFAAAWYGRQDACFVARAGLTATCVDIRSQNFGAMRNLYPAGWEFVRADAYQFVQETTGRWDVVSVDCPSGHFQKCADIASVFCGLANHAVILGTGVDTTLDVPAGWTLMTRNRRSLMYGGVFWTVLTRD
jgi:hypothetical protein